jgi:hypothetical protein
MEDALKKSTRGPRGMVMKLEAFFRKNDIKDSVNACKIVIDG